MYTRFLWAHANPLIRYANASPPELDIAIEAVIGVALLLASAASRSRISTGIGRLCSPFRASERMAASAHRCLRPVPDVLDIAVHNRM